MALLQGTPITTEGPGRQLSFHSLHYSRDNSFGIFSSSKKNDTIQCTFWWKDFARYLPSSEGNTRRAWLPVLLPSIECFADTSFWPIPPLEKCAWAKTHLLVIELKNASFWLEVVWELLLLQQIYFAFQGFNCTQHGAVLINPSEFNIYSGGVNMLILHASLSWE